MSTPVKKILIGVVDNFLCLLCSTVCNNHKCIVLDKYGNVGVAYELAVYFFSNELALVDENYGTYLCQPCARLVKRMRKNDEFNRNHMTLFQQSCQKVHIRESSKRSNLLNTPTSAQISKMIILESNSGTKYPVSSESSFQITSSESSFQASDSRIDIPFLSEGSSSVQYERSTVEPLRVNLDYSGKYLASFYAILILYSYLPLHRIPLRGIMSYWW